MGQKKVTQPLRTKKITQHIGTNKNHATSLDEEKKSCNILGRIKSRNLSGHKKITQPLRTKKMRTLGTKKITQPLVTKESPVTSWNKKKSGNLSGQKNHVTSWDKKITQPLGTKKSCNLWGQKQSM